MGQGTLGLAGLQRAVVWSELEDNRSDFIPRPISGAIDRFAKDNFGSPVLPSNVPLSLGTRISVHW